MTIAFRLTDVLEPMVRALTADGDNLVRRAAVSGILISLRPYNVDNAKTAATIAGSNLSFVCPPPLSHLPPFLVLLLVQIHFLHESA